MHQIHKFTMTFANNQESSCTLIFILSFLGNMRQSKILCVSMAFNIFSPYTFLMTDDGIVKLNLDEAAKNIN